MAKKKRRVQQARRHGLYALRDATRDLVDDSPSTPAVVDLVAQWLDRADAGSWDDSSAGGVPSAGDRARMNRHRRIRRRGR